MVTKFTFRQLRNSLFSVSKVTFFTALIHLLLVTELGCRISLQVFTLKIDTISSGVRSLR